MLSWSALAAFMVLQLLGLPRSLEAAATPLVVPPSQSWDGNDGPWSSFFLRVGTPPQSVRVMVSTASNQPRGALFQINGSSSYYVPSWIHNNSPEGIFSLGIDTNLGYSGNGVYGYDNVSLGDSLPALGDQVVGGITTKDFFLGLLGVNPAATNFPYMTSPVPSYLSTLKEQNFIPSLSYAYTAGNQYRFNKVLGSLTLGGYDASLFEPNELTMAFGSTSDLTINVNKITMSSKNGNKTLGSTSFSASIDSTMPYLYLPEEVCQQFEDAFGIVYDTPSGLYLVNDTLHTQLLSEAANITFTLTDEKSKVLVDIVLPYQAFDLVAQWPLVQNDTRYFPLKRAADNNQTTLGRAFLQEAYLIADYERSNFSVSQRKWDANAKSSIQAISLSSDTSTTHKKTSVGLYAGIAIGIAVLLTVLVAGFIILRKKYRNTRDIRTELRSMPAHSPKPSQPGSSLARSSLPSFSLSSNSEPLKRDDYQYQPVMVSPSLTYFSGSELDAVSTELQSPEIEGKKDYFQSYPGRSISARSADTLSVIHELPARELVHFDNMSGQGRSGKWNVTAKSAVVAQVQDDVSVQVGLLNYPPMAILWSMVEFDFSGFLNQEVRGDSPGRFFGESKTVSKPNPYLKTHEPGAAKAKGSPDYQASGRLLKTLLSCQPLQSEAPHQQTPFGAHISDIYFIPKSPRFKTIYIYSSTTNRTRTGTGQSI
ncbi:hypothetical protein LHYA1_G009079 [Lachnellula hyalina]|uniref:Peptidase A1 domain-containing protein n=1 Tax=Lachnellula hyalina TaxID=1316788 RepID=A0A8H8QT32_9HELO|nr:uncharacterized protein LHYA1_G009079 [Lachnellula hyalina]TVY22268.1 hypothetical protein LHYA1_G009079 [Lachnellula hyalina]